MGTSAAAAKLLGSITVERYHLLRGRMVQYSGVYTHAGEENLATYLQTIGVPPAARKAAGDAPPSLEISQSGSEWSMTWRTARMNNTVQFTLGEEFEEKGF